MVYFFAITVGIFATAMLPVLPRPGWFLAASAAAIFISLILFRRGFKRTTAVLLCWLAGIAYGLWFGFGLLQQQLPTEMDQTTVQMTGYVLGLPVSDSQSVRFRFQVESVNAKEAQWLMGKTLRLSWFDEVSLAPGERWQLEARLKRPRGFVNPGGFDYHAWLLRQGISASGSVRVSDWNRQLEALSSRTVFIDRWRWQLRQRIAALPLSETAKGLVAALSIGDSSLLSQDHWRSFARAGIIHLLIISGLHIGLAAALGYWLGGAAGRLAGLFNPAINAIYWAGCGSLLVATAFALLSGFALPAQRALVMTLVGIFILVFARNIQRGTGFALALVAVAVADPLAIYSAGFWLSFVAVAVLIWLLPRSHTRYGRLRQFWIAQWYMFVALWAILIYWQLPQSVLSPLVNLLAIPWVSLLIVPLCLLAVLISPLMAGPAEWLWGLAGLQLEWLANIVRLLPNWPMPPFAAEGAGFLALAVIAIYLLLPLGFSSKYLAMVLLLALATAKNLQKREIPLEVTILDVGQGLAVVVKASGHTLLYDTGARFSDRFDAGSGIVAPFLKRSGINRFDMLLVSHDDNDHAGGTEGLLSEISTALTIAGEPFAGMREDVLPCRQGMVWRWGEVDFQMLSPASAFPATPTSHNESEELNSNNRSCVLLIQFRGDKILLPGDIESGAEAELLETAPHQLTSIKLLVAPHHGSKTSSSWPFLKHATPQYVVFSAGYKHHFGHPNQAVVQRYRALGTQTFETALSGAITFRWDQNGKLQISRARDGYRHYWH